MIRKRLRGFVESDIDQLRSALVARRFFWVLLQCIKLHESIEQAFHRGGDVCNAENGALLLADPGTQQLVSYHSIDGEPVVQAYELINNRCEGDEPVPFRSQQLHCTNSRVMSVSLKSLISTVIP